MQTLTNFNTSVIAELVNALPNVVVYNKLWVAEFEETENYWVATIWVQGKGAGFIVPKKYNNLWPLRIERAVRETLENIHL